MCQMNRYVCMYNLDAIWEKDELIGFWGQNVKGQAYRETKYSQKGTLEILKVKFKGQVKVIRVDGLPSRII